MTAQEARLCGLLLREHFGEVVEKVGVHLLRSGTLNLRALAHETSTSLDLVTLAFFSEYTLRCILLLFRNVDLFYFSESCSFSMTTVVLLEKSCTFY